MMGSSKCRRSTSTTGLSVIYPNSTCGYDAKNTDKSCVSVTFLDKNDEKVVVIKARAQTYGKITYNRYKLLYRKMIFLFGERVYNNLGQLLINIPFRGLKRFPNFSGVVDARVPVLLGLD